eukprot:732462-Pelagomonas_calceolata.AAC.5
MQSPSPRSEALVRDPQPTSWTAPWQSRRAQRSKPGSHSKTEKRSGARVDLSVKETPYRRSVAARLEYLGTLLANSRRRHSSSIQTAANLIYVKGAISQSA